MVKRKYKYKLEKGITAATLTEVWLNTRGGNGWKLVGILEQTNGKYTLVFIRE